jgi:hypothetical protein
MKARVDLKKVKFQYGDNPEATVVFSTRDVEVHCLKCKTWSNLRDVERGAEGGGMTGCTKCGSMFNFEE